MLGGIGDLFKTFIRELQKHRVFYFLAGFLILISLILRVWRIDELLAFHYDQGRDALVIDRILAGDFVLIGPTTGLDGVFLGPFYYYFLAPGYMLGQGNPIAASIWQTIFVLIGFGIVGYLLKRYFTQGTALIGLFLMTFSFSEISDNRWLANPTPTTFFSPLTILFLSLSIKNPKVFLPLSFLGLGILLQLEAATSFFLLLLTAVFVFLNKQRFNFKVVILSIGVFLVTLITQIIFELKNNFLLTRNFLGFLTNNTYNDTSATFTVPSVLVLKSRLDIFAATFLEKLKISFDTEWSFIFVLVLIGFGILAKKYWSIHFIQVASIWFFGSLLIFLFYQGNYGRIYDYYFTPLVPIFYIFLSIGLAELVQKRFLKVAIMVLLALFLYEQIKFSQGYLTSGLDGKTIALGNQVKAVEYVLNDAGNNSFNVDVYVPPVIPHVYEYLFMYYGRRYDLSQSPMLEPLLYTIHEYDGEMPQRENSWLTRQEKIGRIISGKEFGGVRVEKRNRIIDEK